MNVNVEKVVNSAIIDILRKNTFYGHVICQLPKVFTTSVETMAVGRKNEKDLLISLFINPEYVQAKYNEAGVERAFDHIVEVIKHEIFHIIFRHVFLNEKSDRQKMILACELSVNSYIDENKLLDKGEFPRKYGLPDGLGMEEYYDRLPDTPKSQKMKIVIGESKGKTSGGGSSSGKNNDEKKEEKGKEKGEKGKGKGKEEEIEIFELDSHDEWRKIKDEKISEIVLKDILDKAKKAAVSSGQWGNVPSAMRESIDSFLTIEEQKISWQTALRDFIASSSETILDYTNKKKSRRFGTRPGTKKDDKLRLAIGIDTSGSIDNDMLKMFFSELYWISRQNAEITVFECDCRIGDVYPFSEWNPEKRISGGGGTDLEPVIQRASDEDYDALVYFTDGMAPKISTNYMIPVLMVIPETLWMNHDHMSEIPYPCKMIFFVDKETGKVKVM